MTAVGDFGIVALLIAFGMFVMRPSRSDRLAMLRSMVDDHKGTLERIAGGHRLKLSRDGFAVEIEVIPYLRAVWRVAPCPWLGSAQISPSHVGATVGIRELQLGVRFFDLQYAVRTRDLATLRKLMSKQRCQVMFDHYRNCTLKLGDGRIELRQLELQRAAGAEPNGRADLDRGLAFVVDLARADVCAMAVLDALPDATREPTRAGMPCVQVDGPGTIRVGPHLEHDVLLTRATSVVTSQVSDLDLSVADGVVEDHVLAGLPVELRAHVRALGTAHLRSTGEEIVITWPAIEDDPQRLTAAIEVLRVLGRAPAGGAFR